MLIIFSTGILCSSNLYATNETQTDNATSDVSTLSQPLNNSDNSAETPKLAANNTTSSFIRGIWIKAEDAQRLNQTSVQSFKNANITDVFVLARNVTGATGYQNILNHVIGELNGTGIRIHAWIICFRVMYPDGSWGWINPHPDKYQVRVQRILPYRVRVRKWIRTRRFIRGRWQTRWVRRWINVTRHRTIYRNETRYNNTHSNNLIRFISSVTEKFSGRIHGIHLDYVRYSGLGDNSAHKHNGTEVITSFVRRVHETVKRINPNIQLSAALMPESKANTGNYGECYTRLSNYLNFKVDNGASGYILNSAITQAKPIYITSDNINSVRIDTNRINTIVNGLMALGLKAVNWGLGPNTHYAVLQDVKIPENALIINIYGGACAGTIYEMGLNYYKKLVRARKVFSVWIPPAANISGLAWLPRAHDDNFSPSRFRGLANPDKYLLNNGYEYIYSGDLNTIISAIYKHTTA